MNPFEQFFIANVSVKSFLGVGRETGFCSLSLSSDGSGLLGGLKWQKGFSPTYI
jgi:hypothetical protein